MLWELSKYIYFILFIKKNYLKIVIGGVVSQSQTPLKMPRLGKHGSR